MSWSRLIPAQRDPGGSYVFEYSSQCAGEQGSQMFDWRTRSTRAVFNWIRAGQAGYRDSSIDWYTVRMRYITQSMSRWMKMSSCRRRGRKVADGRRQAAGTWQQGRNHWQAPSHPLSISTWANATLCHYPYVVSKIWLLHQAKKTPSCGPLAGRRFAAGDGVLDSTDDGSCFAFSLRFDLSRFAWFGHGVYFFLGLSHCQPYPRPYFVFCISYLIYAPRIFAISKYARTMTWLPSARLM